MTKFVIISTQRSGTIYLQNSLSSHPRIQCYAEIFLSKKYQNKQNPIRQLIYNASYKAFRNASLNRQIAHIFRRKYLINDFLTKLYTLETTKKAIGFKFMYNQITQFPEAANWLKEQNVSIIHLIRTNILKTVVSLKTAQLRGVYSSTKPLAPIKVRLQPPELIVRMAKIQRLIEQHRQQFAGQPYLEVTYESFVGQNVDETRRILQFLNIDDFALLTSRSVKINPDTLKEIIENYDEVAKALKGTAFEQFLKD